MFQTIHYEDILKNKLNGSYIFADVRSPEEYNTDTIPGAINLPLFTDEERKLIGTIYDNESTEKAKQLGIEAASKKLPFIYDRIAELNNIYNNIIIFCARGGYRSSTLVSLFKTLGINAVKLDSGYKGYRKFVFENLPKELEKIKFIVLYGNTGSGKTHILEEIQRLGNDVLDLESCANHRGSLLGSIGMGKQNSQKMFESLVYNILINRKSDVIFTEGESKRIGKIIMPECLYNAIDSGINIKIEADLKKRIEFLLEDYVHDDNSMEIIEALSLLKHNLGERIVNNYIELINNNEHEKVIEDLILKYYDPHYEFKSRKYEAVFSNNNSRETAELIHNARFTIHNGKEI